MTDLDDQNEALLASKGRGHHRSDGNGYIPKSIQEALIIAALFGLVGAWWTFGKSIAVLQSVTESQQRQLDKLDRRQDTLEGRIVRGHIAGGPDAPDQQ